MRTRRAILVAAVMFIAVRATAAEAPVWFWFATCGGPVMGLEVTLDGATLYRGEFPICRAARASRSGQGQEAGRVRFLVKPDRSITWVGYREPAAVSTPGHLLNADIWQAGADAEDLLLGVSVSDERDIFMNTIHIAHPGKRDESSIADGLKVVTFPVNLRGPRTP